MWNLEAGFASRLDAFMREANGRVEIVSGYRSIERQTELWDRELAEWIAKGYPSEADGATGPNTAEEMADNWVARPGHSNHQHGLACDISFVDDEAEAWAHANAHRFGLEFPMDWEPWHIEPIGLAGGTYEGMPEGWDPRYGYTVFPGALNPSDQQNRRNMFAETFDQIFMTAAPDPGGLTPDAPELGATANPDYVAGPDSGAPAMPALEEEGRLQEWSDDG